MEKVILEVPASVLIETGPPDTVVSVEANTVIVKDRVSDTVVLDPSGYLVNSEILRETVVLGGSQGPPGPPGPPGAAGEEDMLYSKRVDFVDNSTIYRAEAAVGSSEVTGVWRIRKIILSPDGDVTETWAGGNTNFDKNWSLRTTYTYS